MYPGHEIAYHEKEARHDAKQDRLSRLVGQTDLRNHDQDTGKHDHHQRDIGLPELLAKHKRFDVLTFGGKEEGRFISTVDRFEERSGWAEAEELDGCLRGTASCQIFDGSLTTRMFSLYKGIARGGAGAVSDLDVSRIDGNSVKPTSDKKRKPKDPLEADYVRVIFRYNVPVQCWIDASEVVVGTGTVETDQYRVKILAKAKDWPEGAQEQALRGVIRKGSTIWMAEAALGRSYLYGLRPEEETMAEVREFGASKLTFVNGQLDSWTEF